MTEQPPPGYGYDQQHNPPAAARPGELVDRFVARLLDTLLLIAVNILIVGLLVTSLIFGTSVSAFSGGGSFAANFVGTVLGVAINMGYFVYMETTRGETVGKMAMKLKVIGPTGQNPTPEESVKRNIWLAFGLAGIIPWLGIIGGLASLAAVILIAVGISQDTERRQAWHDRFAGGTRVLKVG